MKFRYAGIEFGGQHGNILVRREGFDDSGAEIRTQDSVIPHGDGVTPGTDFLGGATWAFDMVTNRHSLQEAMVTEAQLAAAWKDRTVRTTPGLRVPLSYDLGDGKWRRVYGRPGQYAGPKGTTQAKQGAGAITADFRVMDHRFFDEEEQTVTMSIVPASGGGLRAPLRAPLAAGYAGEPRVREVQNTGNAPTPLKATFYGPIIDPWVRDDLNGWWFGLKGTLAFDVSVTVDPLTRTVVRSDGARVAGTLVGTALTRVELPAATPTDLTFGGTDITGTARVDLMWRNASYSIGG